MAQPAKKAVPIDTNEFVRTRDALASAYMSLSASIDKTVKAYLDHTNAVLAGEGTLNIAILSQPFHQLSATAQQVLQGAAPVAAAAPADEPAEEPAEDGKKKKRNYKPRDPNAPKRPLTAYFQFLKVHRPQVAADMQAANGGVPAKPGDISNEATNRWNSLDDKQKQIWKDMYNEEMSGYEERSRAYKISIGAPLDEDDPVKMEKKAAAKAKRDAKKAGAAAGSATAGAAPAGDDSDSDSSSDEDDDIEEPAAPPPKATPAATKKTPKSALKKTVPPTPQFSSINNNATTTATPSAAPASSPERKRKAPAASASAEGGPKKRGRKSNAEKAAEQLATETATPAKATPAAAEAKKEKKPRKKKGEA